MAWQDRWTADEFRQRVRKLVYEDGLSAAQAARALGADVTKNMCIRAMQTLQGKRTTVTFPDSVWPSEPKTREPREIDAPAVPAHITKIRDGQCRAPLWPDFLRSTQKVPTSEHMLCGHKCKEGSTYCAEHHALFYPPEMQVRKAPKSRSKKVDNTQHFR